MRYTDDPAADYNAYCADQERRMQKLPRCIMCDERITDDRCWDFGDGAVCDDCAEQHYRKDVDDLCLD